MKLRLLVLVLVVHLSGITLCIADNDALSTEFPENPVAYHVLPDNRIVLCGSSSVYLSSSKTPLEWTDIRLHGYQLPDKMALLRPVGGGANVLLFLAVDRKGEWVLLAIHKDLPAKELRRTPGRHAVAFASDQIGVIGTESSKVQVTIDGGNSWGETDPLWEGQTYARSLLWIDDNQLLAGSSDGIVHYLLRDGKTFSTLWSTKIANGPIYDLIVDGGYIWARPLDQGIKQLNLKSGEITAEIKPHVFVERMAVCHDHLFFSSTESTEIWKKQTDGYVKVKEIQVQHIRAMFELPDTQCLAISSYGRAMTFNVNALELAPAHLQVISPVPEQAPDENGELISRMAELAKKLPREKRSQIFAEARQKKHLTPKERVEWAIQQMEELIATQEADPVNQ